MKATLVECDGEHATVRLTPSWLARLFGAREAVVELEGRPELKGGRYRWYTAGTERELCELEHAALIRHVLARGLIALVGQSMDRLARLEADAARAIARRP